MNLIYLVFGKRVSYHYEAIFSICSFLSFSKSVENVLVYTDAPEFYKHISDKVLVRPLAETELKQWMGEYDFFWRVKIKAMEDAISRFPNKKIVYLDSDTFIYKSLDEFDSLLTNGDKAFMHKKEAIISNSPSHTQTRMWKQMKGKTFEGVTINKDHAMWNAGFIALPIQKQEEVIAFALQLCDSMSAAKVTPRLIEQFAFSLALQERYILLPADDFVGHYWGNKKEWDIFISNYFIQSYFQNQGIEDEIKNIRNIDFKQMSLLQKERTLFLRINKLLKKCFPPKTNYLN